MIKKVGRKYVVVSETTGRKFGAYRTVAEAKARLRQIEMFKHVRASRRARRDDSGKRSFHSRGGGR